MEKVIRYESQQMGWGALPSVITLQSGECQDIPMAIDEGQRRVCNRNMLGREMVLFVSELPSEYLDSQSALAAWTRSFAAGRKIEMVSKEEINTIKYHDMRMGNLRSQRQRNLPAVAANQSAQSVVIYPRHGQPLAGAQWATPPPR